jgi:Right handed beta helix region
METTRSLPRSVGRLAAGGSLLLGGVGTALFLAPQAGATGSTFTVTNTDDSGTGSLRQAISDANSNSGHDTIVFAQGVAGTIALTRRLEVLHGLDIQGPGSTVVSISGQGTQQAFYLYDHNGGVTGNISISGLTITDAGSASAVVCWKTNLTLDDVAITNSTVKDAALNLIPAGLNPSLTIRNSTFSGNTKTGTDDLNGGAVSVNDGASDVTITNTTFSNNVAQQGNGGALGLKNTGDATITGSTFTGNTVQRGNPGGGAIEVENHGNFTMTNSTVSNNTATTQRGGGIFFASSGGIGKSITIANSTFSGNSSATGAGALYFRTNSDVAINNSTITGNTTGGGGGGIMVSSVASIAVNQSTITANTSTSSNANSAGGGGILLSPCYLISSDPVVFSGTILSGNTSGVAGRADFGLYHNSLTIRSNSSLLGSIDSRTTINGTGNVSSTNPNLGALANNGGLTKTMAPNVGSPAINAGPSPVASFTGNQFDQRGTGFARVVGSSVDIGAFEFGATSSSSSSSSSTTTTVPSSTTTTGSSGRPIGFNFGLGSSIRSGTLSLTLNGNGGKPGAPFQSVVHSVTTVLGDGVVDAQGLFGGTYLLPADLAPGAHDVTVTTVDASGNPLLVQAWFSIDSSGTVTAISYDGPTPDTSSALPTTGSDSRMLIEFGVGAALLGSGMAAVAARRRQSLTFDPNNKN